MTEVVLWCYGTSAAIFLVRWMIQLHRALSLVQQHTTLRFSTLTGITLGSLVPQIVPILIVGSVLSVLALAVRSLI